MSTKINPCHSCGQPHDSRNRFCTDCYAQFTCQYHSWLAEQIAKANEREREAREA